MISVLKIQAGLLLYLHMTYASLMTKWKNTIEKPACGGLLFASVYAVRGPEYGIGVLLSFYSCGDKHQVSRTP